MYIKQNYKPCSVFDNHLSRQIVTNLFKQSTYERSEQLQKFNLDLAPNGVYIAI